MPPLNFDAFGEAYGAYLNGRKDAKISVSSNVDPDDEIPASYFFRDFDSMPELEKMALLHCKGSVLDVGAGAGSHALFLQGLGCNVTAMDISDRAVNIMRSRGVEKVIQADFFEFRSTAPFDILLFLMNGFGIAGTIEGLKELLSKAKTLLKPGGKILGESADIAYTATQEDGSVLLNLNGPYYGELEYELSFDGRKMEPFPWLYVDFDTLSKYAAECGFESRMLFHGAQYEYLAELVSN